MNDVLDNFIVAAARWFLYSFDGGKQSLFKNDRWNWYRMAMKVVYDDSGYIRFNPDALPCGLEPSPWRRAGV